MSAIFCLPKSVVGRFLPRIDTGEVLGTTRWDALPAWGGRGGQRGLP